MKENVIDAALKELGESTIIDCDVPTKVDLISATKENPLSWDHVINFSCSKGQPNESFEEQKFAISVCRGSAD